MLSLSANVCHLLISRTLMKNIVNKKNLTALGLIVQSE
jgi:hypothetical protein